MRKTTIYLPDDLKQALETVAEQTGTSEATFVRRALERAVADAIPPRPRLPLFESDEPTLAERVDDALAGFGER